LSFIRARASVNKTNFILCDEECSVYIGAHCISFTVFPCHNDRKISETSTEQGAMGVKNDAADASIKNIF
jgi:hypothetical protein